MCDASDEFHLLNRITAPKAPGNTSHAALLHLAQDGGKKKTDLPLVPGGVLLCVAQLGGVCRGLRGRARTRRLGSRRLHFNLRFNRSGGFRRRFVFVLLREGTRWGLI